MHAKVMARLLDAPIFPEKRSMPRFLLLCVLAVSCVGSPVHRTIHYNSVQGAITDNNRHLLELHVGMPSATLWL